MDERYRPEVVEAKWQERWNERGTNRVELAHARRPYYALMMFPYPSAEGLHVGHAFAFPGVDIHARFRRLQGYDVFEPIGFDAFGIHSENYALKVGRNPKQLIPDTIANFRRQLRRLGLMVNWEHVVDTTSPDYYRWTQWIFLQFYKHGLAERKKAPVNWCPACKTVLANEQVIDGFCERHPDTRVEQRFTAQWFFTITRYAQRLLDDLSWIDWSETTKRAQVNWIGRSEGAEIGFTLATRPDCAIRVFTTRPDTLFGATYLVLAPEHPLVAELATPEQRAAVDTYQQRVARMDLVTRKSVQEKKGVFTGSNAINPASGARIPIWIADYVLLGYGTGAIMAVPAHDQRDFEFAKVFDLPILEVIRPCDSTDGPGALEAAYVSDRETCGTVPVAEKDLPVLLPDTDDFRPDASGVAPLGRLASFVNVACPQCGAPARRETDVSDTFLDSAWYFLRYPSTDRNDVAMDPELTRRWLPVDMYIGGNEHAVLHLMYARFVTMALHDIGLLNFDEPFKKFRAHGIIVKDGRKCRSRAAMSSPRTCTSTGTAPTPSGFT